MLYRMLNMRCVSIYRYQIAYANPDTQIIGFLHFFVLFYSVHIHLYFILLWINLGNTGRTQTRVNYTE